ncbi:2-oxoglutarate and iron-dependent oxygenase JMJD4 homolog [Contarinia nasturtii]|uniref:2-oxoglutarate and iron-dependent oxygenase JMJD4 homolog n=1 Tax=Contarinia nasturtii TaxID=265458 RepID=UPI0012D4397D|nr:2-oxoglutarate and iron-dependent oxygenase JMJD4 homolog [Contarinia nasturtii]
MCENEIEIENYDKYKEPSFQFVAKIEEYHINNLSYNDFFDRFMVKNIPVLINGIADRWECQNWIDSSHLVNIEYLRQKIDKTQNVPIANCGKVYYNSHEKSEMQFGAFVDYWTNKMQQNECDSTNLLYLKDWHLRRSQPDYQFYTTPIYFASDWLNEYCVEKRIDDYRFVYMGPKGTWTPFHADVFSSFSWSTNIVGTKKWIFLPPQEEDKLRDNLGNLPFDIDEEKYQNLIHEKNVRSFEVIQRAGQTVFVPSGWHHQVWNLEDTISVNHNWFNGCNIHCIWNAIYAKYKDVLREIDDCKDMDGFDEHCQLMLKSDFGLDFQMFLDILECVATNRLKILQMSCELMLNESKLGRKHSIYDLMSIRRVLEDFYTKCILENLQKSSQALILEINQVLR